jgi:hypothetical protein
MTAGTGCWGRRGRGVVGGSGRSGLRSWDPLGCRMALDASGRVRVRDIFMSLQCLLKRWLSDLPFA